MAARVTPLPHCGRGVLQDEARQVGVLRELADPLADIPLVDHDFGAAGLIRGGEADPFAEALESRGLPARTDGLDGGLDLLVPQCDLVDGVRSEIELDPFGRVQGALWLDQAGF